MTRSFLLLAATGTALALSPALLAAQQPVTVAGASVASLDDRPAASVLVRTAPAAAPKPLTARWLDLTAFSHSQRYRNQYGDNGTHYFEDGQERSLLAGKIKLDAGGRLAIGFRASSGRSFNWAYADYAGKGFESRLRNPDYDTDVSHPENDPNVAEAYANDPGGVHAIENLESAGWEFYIRELYLSATPVKPLTLQFGSFGIERGFSTEITTFDDDGYIEGERAILQDPKHLFFDKVTLTSAFLGDFGTPNFFARATDITKSNYRQAAVKKQLSPRVGISGEYNWISNDARTHTAREAIVVDIKESKVLDRFRLEGYEMLSRVYLQATEDAPRQGFALAGEKKLGKLLGDFGFASIDRNYGVYGGSSFLQEVGFSLNGDNYNTGIRVFSHLQYKLTPVITAFGFYTRITGENITNLDTQGLNAGLNFDLKALVNTRKAIF